MTTEKDAVTELAGILGMRAPTVFFGGAGTSTESNIPDFRSAGGLYSTSYHGREPEYLLSIQCLRREPELFYDYLREKLYYPDARPNPTHRVLHLLEQRGSLRSVITQNIDGLHQAAGSRHVIELHGTMAKALCMACGAPHPGQDLFPPKAGVPRCSRCGGILRPKVTLYGEALDQDSVEAAIHELSRAQVLIVGGTSLAVYPAAGFLAYFRGHTLVLMNRDATPIDKKASLILRTPIGASMAQAYELAFGESVFQ